MKKIKSCVVLLGCLFTVWGCQKDSSTARVTKIETGKTVIAKGETLAVQIQNPDAGSVSRWSLQPSTGVIMDSLYSRSSNKILFTQPGTYVIHAEMRTIHQDCKPSPSWDTCYNNAANSQKLATTITVKN